VPAFRTGGASRSAPGVLGPATRRPVGRVLGDGPSDGVVVITKHEAVKAVLVSRRIPPLMARVSPRWTRSAASSTGCSPACRRRRARRDEDRLRGDRRRSSGRRRGGRAPACLMGRGPASTCSRGPTAPARAASPGPCSGGDGSSTSTRTRPRAASSPPIGYQPDEATARLGTRAAPASSGRSAERLRLRVRDHLGGRTITACSSGRRAGIEVRVWYVGLTSRRCTFARVRAGSRRAGTTSRGRESVTVHASRLNLIRLLPSLIELWV